MANKGFFAAARTAGATRRRIASSLLMLGVALLLAVPPAQAAYECNVAVKYVLIYRDGMVNVWHTGRRDYTFVCSLKGTYAGVDPATCAMWTAMLQNIKNKNGVANFYFEGTGSCDAMGTYSNAPVPVYIGDLTPRRHGG